MSDPVSIVCRVCRIGLLFRVGLLPLVGVSWLSMVACSSAPARVATLDGAQVVPLVGKPGRLAVFVFLVDGCPIANALAPEIARIGGEAIDCGVAVYLVYPDPTADADAIRAHNRDFGLAFPTLLDREQRVTRAVEASVSPEAAVVRFDAQGGFEVVYRGRVNDLFEAPGRRRPAARSNDLADALCAALSEMQPEHPRTKAVGCVIEPISSR